MSDKLLTQEVGSLAKQDWRVLPINQSRLDESHIEGALAWADRLDLDVEETAAVLHEQADSLKQTGSLSDYGTLAIKRLAARFAVRLQEKAGLDIIYDGEQDRSEMYQHAIERTEGFEWRGRVRAFDNKSYKKAAVVAEPGVTGPWHGREVDRLRSLTDHDIKVPITGAYTLGAWSFDEYYTPQGLTLPAARRQLILDLARHAIRPNVKSLLAQGVDWIQIDEPAATTVPEEVPLFVEAFNESVRGLAGKFSVHICFSDYNLLFPHSEALENCSQFSLEFANRDGSQLGRDAAHRPAYDILHKLKKHNPESGVGLGVSSVHDDILESPELIRDRVLRAVDILDDPAKVYPSPDCGLRTRSWEVAYDKLRTTVEGTLLAREAFNG